MCLPPGPPERLVPPSSKARELAEYFRVVVWEQVALSALLVVAAGDWYWATWGLVGALVGRLAVSREAGYSVRQTIFFAVWTGISFLFAAYRASLYFRGLADSSPWEPWAFYLYNFAIVAQFVFYALAAVVTRVFFRELSACQAEFLAANPDPGPAGQGGPGAAAAAAPPSGGGSALSAPAAAPPSFRAFSGSGNRLG